MPAVVGESVSYVVASLNTQWMGCIAHQLNTIIRHVTHEISLLSVKEKLSKVHADLLVLKSILCYMKDLGKNYNLPEGYALFQECKTTLGTALGWYVVLPSAHGHRGIF